jgi:hypothetical protein
VDVLNLQDLVNGIDWIARNLKRKDMHRPRYRPTANHLLW